MAAQILRLGDEWPKVDDEAYIAAGAVVVGDVIVAAGASVWFNCVLRGDVARITIGERTNVQDGAILHSDPGLPTTVGADVTIGHMALVHGCTIQDRAFVGMGALVMSGAVIESGAMLAAGAMLTANKTIPEGQLWAGRPAKYVRDLAEEEKVEMREACAHYRRNGARFRRQAAPA